MRMGAPAHAEAPRTDGPRVDDEIESVLPWYRRRAGVAVAAVGLVLALVVTAKAFTAGKRAETNATPAPAPSAAAAPEQTPPPPAPVATAPPPPAPPPAPPVKVAEAEPAAKAQAEDDKPAEKPVEKPVDDEPAAAPEPKSHKGGPSTVAVTFRTDPEGARVATKNHVYGTTPQPAKLPPGTYDLTFTKAGYAPASKKYVVPAAAKGPQTVRVSLKKLPDPPKKAAPAATPPPAKKGWWFSR
jgi:hypothetical protein